MESKGTKSSNMHPQNTDLKQHTQICDEIIPKKKKKPTNIADSNLDMNLLQAEIINITSEQRDKMYYTFVILHSLL